MRTLIEADWLGELTVFDYVQSCLVEMPDHFLQPEGVGWVYFLDRDLGLIHIINEDFVKMNDQEISDYILEVLEKFKS